MTREEHLRWAKGRAIEYADRGENALAVSSMASGLNKHPGTAGHAAVPLMVSDVTKAITDGTVAEIFRKAGMPT
jgi:hypothetical protein